MSAHHANKKMGIGTLGYRSATGDYSYLIECPRQFGQELRDGRAARVDPTTVPELANICGR